MKKSNGKFFTMKFPMWVRVIAVLLVFALVVPNVPALAGSSNPTLGQSQQDDEQLLADEDAVYEITAKNRTIPPTLKEELDLMEDVFAKDGNGEDFTSSLETETLDNFDPTVTGDYQITYKLVVKDKLVAETTMTLTVSSAYIFEASLLEIHLETVASLEEIDFLEDISVTDLNKNDFTEFLSVDSESLKKISLDVSEDYKLTYLLTIDEIVVERFSRDVSVSENGIAFFAPTITLDMNTIYEENLPKDSFKHSILSGISAFNQDGEDFTEFIQLTNDGGGEDFNIPGEYTIQFAVVKDDKTLASANRNVRIVFSGRERWDSPYIGGDNNRGVPQPPHNLGVSVYANGTVGIHKWMKEPKKNADDQDARIRWIMQYYSLNEYGKNVANTNSITLRLNDATQPENSSISSGDNGEDTTDNYNGVSYFASRHGIGNGNWVTSNFDSIETLPIETAADGTQSITRVLKTGDASGRYSIPNVELHETLSLESGANTIIRHYDVINNSGTEINARVIYGGDTYFSGFDCGWGDYIDSEGGKVTVWRGSDQGTMSLIGDPSNKMDGYFVGYQATGKEHALRGYLGKTIGENAGPIPQGADLSQIDWYDISRNADIPELNYIDQSYYASWDKNGIPDGSNSDILFYEVFTDAGDIQLQSNGNKETYVGTTVTHDFTVTNMTMENPMDYELRFTAESSNGWDVTVNPVTIASLLAGNNETVSVDLKVPAVDSNGNIIPVGTTDTIILKAEFRIVNANGTTEQWIPKEATSITTIIEPNEILPTSLTLTPQEISIKVAQVYDHFTVSFVPANATDKDVLWESSNLGIFTVDALGKVTGVSPGTATLTVSSKNNAAVKDTATVHVTKDIESIKISPNIVTLKKEDTADFLAEILPTNASNKSVTWTIGDTAIASMIPSAGNQAKATVTAVSDGITKITATSDENVIKKSTATVQVDGTVPEITQITLTETNQPWRASNKAFDVTITANDPNVNGFSSGVKNIYYRTVEGSTVPTFGPVNTTGWTKVSGDTAQFLLSSTTAGSANGTYSVFAVAEDNVGYFSQPTNKDNSTEIDTTEPEIGITTGKSENIHVLVGDILAKEQLLENITATDDGNDIKDQLTITPSNISATAVKEQLVTYSYTDSAGNTASFSQTVYIHGVPIITANDNVDLNALEKEISLIPADDRINLKHLEVTFFEKQNNGSYKKITKPTTVSAAGDLVSGNKLVFNAPAVTTATYTSSYINPEISPSKVSTTKDVIFTIVPNGTVPGSPIPQVGGVIIPPSSISGIDPGLDPSVIDPLDKTGVNRIEFFKNNGVIKADGSTQPGLSLEDLLKSVTLKNLQETDYTKTPYIDLGGNLNPLTSSILDDTLKDVGQATLVYKLEVPSTNEVLFFTVYLRVNSDIVIEEALPIDTQKGTSVPQSDYDNDNNMKATYEDYTNTIQTVLVTPPSSVDTGTIGTTNLVYTGAYPFAEKTMKRVLRVHGTINLSVEDIHIRQGANLSENEILSKSKAKATIEVAGKTVGSASTTVNLPVTVSPTSRVIGQKDTVFQAKYTLEDSYKPSIGFTEETATKTASVTTHGIPELTATDIVIGEHYTKEIFGDLLTNSLVNIDANVTYFPSSTNSLKDQVKAINFDDIKFGTVGTYKLELTVTDQDAANRPSQLDPMTSTKEITITIKSGNTGDGPTILGAKDIDWLQHNEITGNDISKDVTADAHGNGPVRLSYVLKNGNVEISESEVVKNPGIYTMEYRAIDALGDIQKIETQLHIYGVMLKDSNTPPEVYRTTNETYVVNKSTFKGKYKNPAGEFVSVTYESNPDLFDLKDNPVDLKTRGSYSVITSIKHPIFSTINNVDVPLEVQVNDHIEIVGTDKFANEYYYYVSESKETIDDQVKGVYKNHKGENVTLQVTSSKPSFTGAIADIGYSGITYTVRDDLGFEDVAKSIKIRVNDLPTLMTVEKSYSFDLSTVKTELDITSKIVYRDRFTTYYDNPKNIIHLEPSYDFSGVTLDEAGTYALNIFITDKFGKEVSTNVEIILEDVQMPERPGKWVRFTDTLFTYRYIDDGTSPKNETITIDGVNYTFDAGGMLLYPIPPHNYP